MIYIQDNFLQFAQFRATNILTLATTIIEAQINARFENTGTFCQRQIRIGETSDGFTTGVN